MKLGRFFSGCGIVSTLAISGFFSTSVQAQAQSNRAFIVFVNGSGDCCAESMSQAIARLERGVEGSIWKTSYANFVDGSTTSKVPVVNLSVNADKLFIDEATRIINVTPPDIPVVLIGHSYGGDSILKVLPHITRRVQLVAVIDPVGTGGFRKVATKRVVPQNVDYFLNRWQENGLDGLAGNNVVPFDSRSNGKIQCFATKGCDQQAQNLARNKDASEIRISCEAHEVSCDGWRLPGCNFSGCWQGSNGTKAKRTFHNNMPMDAFIQHTVVEKIKVALRPFGVLK